MTKVIKESKLFQWVKKLLDQPPINHDLMKQMQDDVLAKSLTERNYW